MLIFLTGMPGSGKTTVGKELAAKAGYPFIDLDTYIRESEKKEIPEIFKTQGEEYFRKTETACLKEIIEKQKNGIVSLGGGTPCFNRNMELLSEHGKTVYLQATADTLVSRVEKDKNIRPLLSKLKGEQLKLKIVAMLAHREKFYKQAQVSLYTDNKSSAEVIQKMIDTFFTS